MITAIQRAAFDEAAREEIRRRLRQYMEAHRIGTPALQTRIIEADQPLHRELPLSTLQRFITGAHRTSDSYVAMCDHFLKASAPLEERDFAVTMATFWGAQPLKDGEGTTPFRGTYHRHAYGIGEYAFPLALPFPPQGAARGGMAVSLHASGLCYSVRETAPVGGVSARVPGHRRQYEGAGLMMGGALYIVLRDCLTRRPKSLALSPRTDVPDSGVLLEGTADEPGFERDHLSRGPTARLQYLKQDQEP